jgi:hypothetical protein
VSLRGKPFRREWAACSPFAASYAGRTKVVVYSTTNPNHAALRKLNTALAGGDEALQAGFGGLSAERLAQVMNEHRNAKLASLGDQAG